ncbi:thiamine phosphate synthase [Staphylococcus massiliensis]|uniref:Thiamine-phosphate synthase n=1 Tax=Staphylococcus massiliensis S46 TaxID=1229783 RepID=K9AM51_9STAP|nr:thiamine phosphate synthase [Staphylococcus massiliensis]EKU47146.1 thiamine-phosphate pyrophosphorylase [Staphylococcus massiliensis S46]POA01888.1 thiamine phosphate synthase [Staphylococcus massiliensis CCUG 55927]
MFHREQLKLYFICGTQDVKSGATIKDILKEALEAGITMFQFREKGEGALTGDVKRELALELQSLCQDYQVPFIVNDDVKLAQDIDADGIHVGQDDEDVSAFYRDFEDKIVGLSVGNFEEYDQSDLTHVNYIGVGPVYTTFSKPDAKMPGGVTRIRKMREYDTEIPIVAIGGIHEENIAPIIQQGADGVATISSITKSQNIKETVQRYLEQMK